MSMLKKVRMLDVYHPNFSSSWRRKILRCIYSKTGIWDKDFTIETRKEVESYWHEQLDQYNRNLKCSIQDKRPKFYVLSMFPYPSGRLHMGHVRVYTISDTIAHYQRLNGKQVLHPMGWDAFGLPAENAAIDRGLKPDDWTYSNIELMRKQFKLLSFCFNWEREVTTCLQDYYRWTQAIFVRLFEAGLAYQKESLVNWDPVDQTVLAKEQVDENGCSWRSGAKVEQRLLKQWFLKMTHYSKSLLDGLSDLPDWPSGIRSMQANWIGECSGCAFTFDLQLPNAHEDFSLSVHTPHPELIFGASYVILSPTHTLLMKPEFLQSLAEDVRLNLKQLESSKQDVNLGVSVTHPLTGKPLPLFASSLEQYEENVDSHLGIPCIDAEDEEFASRNGIGHQSVLEGHNLVNSDQFTGLSREEAKEAIMQHAKDLDIGGHMTSPRQFDWLISRQRYWGTPIPIIHCPKCKAVPVPSSDLPVVLPKLDSLTGKGLSPLAEEKDWINVECPKCGSPARRETDTMDTFVDSAWYYLRYTDPTNQEEAFGKKNADWMLPVDVYIGGKEHAIMHLLYARFINHFLYDQGLVAHKEPFKRLLVQGLVMGQSYKVASTGQYLTPEQVDQSGPKPVHRDTGENLVVQWEKMSKSKYNGVDPEATIAQYGADTVRLFILSGIPPDLDMMWNVEAISGVVRWKNRMWNLVTRFIEMKSSGNDNSRSDEHEELHRQELKLRKQLNQCITDVTTHFSEDYLLSVAISRLMTLTNQLRAFPEAFISQSAVFEEAICSLCIMVAPMAPHVASEMWQGVAGVRHHRCSGYDWTKTVLEQKWPSPVTETGDALDHVSLLVKINNKTSSKLQIPASLLQDSDKLREFILENEAGRHLTGRSIKKMIVVPKVPLVNFLLE